MLRLLIDCLFPARMCRLPIIPKRLTGPLASVSKYSNKSGCGVHSRSRIQIPTTPFQDFAIVVGGREIRQKLLI